MEEFPSNQPRPQIPGGEQPNHKLKPVVSGGVVRRKTPLGQKFIHTFIKGSAKTALINAIETRVVPAVKDMTLDGLTYWIQDVLYGGNHQSTQRRPYGVSNGYTNYRSAYQGGNGQRNAPREHRPEPRSERFRFDDVILQNRVDCEVVLEQLQGAVEAYHEAKVSDLLDLLDAPSNYTDQGWGWTDLTEVEIRKVQAGWQLLLPAPEPLKK